jgi:hypothetical protein
MHEDCPFVCLRGRRSWLASLGPSYVMTLMDYIALALDKQFVDPVSRCRGYYRDNAGMTIPSEKAVGAPVGH